MDILVLADIHNTLENVRAALSKTPHPDLILCPGNVTDMFTYTDFSQVVVGEAIIQQLLSTHVPVVMVPGNHDPPELIQLFEEYGVNGHGRSHTLGNDCIGGFGGAQTPFNTLFEPSEQEVQKALSGLTNTTILLTHNPPKNTSLDRLKSGQHVGSQAVRDHILTHRPRLVVTAHIHEAAGVEKLGKSVLFNPGPLADGWYGLVKMNKTISCQRKRI